MKPSYLLLLYMLACSTAVTAADSTERTSPVDNNPACMDRTKNTASAQCTVQDGKPPRPLAKRAKPAKPTGSNSTLAPPPAREK